MKALAILDPERARIVDLPRPAAARGEVRIAISHVGLCGTDLHVFQGAFGRFPMIPGHDAAGVIDAVGSGELKPLLGTRVTIDPSACCLRAAVPSPPCPECARGATNLCANQSYMGISAPGACAEFVVVPAARAVALPATVSALQATCLEPIAVALHLERRIADREGSVAVFGGGPIGLAITRVLMRNRPAILIEPSAARRDFARTHGCPNVCAIDDIGDPLPAILIDAAGHPSVTDVIERRAEPSSLIVLVGGPLEISGRTILTRELEVRAVKGGRGLYPESVALAAKGFDTSRWTETLVPLDAAPAFFEAWSNGNARPFRAAIRVSD